MYRNKGNAKQVLRQVWFPGNHGCVGGGTEAIRGLSDGALLWMMEQIKALGLGLDLDPNAVERGIQPDYSVPFDNSIKGIFTLTGKLLRHIEGDDSDMPLFHDSVIQRWQSCFPPYRPENLRPFESLLSRHNLALASE
ncbi:phospholipase effector Tle1 domain-containing protein [Leptodesmis sp.]|uniref:phospholipase effector Tle1 domain-containing protein n=1 Tax=Leptodesmis sp. TaxID=3100501 RepID=UPI004053500D